MNKQRRKLLEKIVAKLEGVSTELEEIHGEEEQALENIPDNLKEGKVAQDMEEAVDEIISIKDDIDNAIENLQILIGNR